MIAFLLSPIGRLLGVAALTALLVGGGVWWATSTVYAGRIATIQGEYAKADAARANAVLAKYTADATVIHTAAQSFLAGQGVLSTKIADIQKDLLNVQAKTPLPRGCRPDSARLRILSAAVAAANAASGP